jgi:hypothetical protein
MRAYARRRLPSRSIDAAAIPAMQVGSGTEATEMSLTQISPVAALLPPESMVILIDSALVGAMSVSSTSVQVVTLALPAGIIKSVEFPSWFGAVSVSSPTESPK